MKKLYEIYKKAIDSYLYASIDLENYDLSPTNEILKNNLIIYIVTLLFRN
jgi:hypothetical protein